MELKRITYDYYLKNQSSADMIVTCVDRKVHEDDVFCLIEYPNGFLFTVQEDIGILPIFKEIPSSSRMILSLNANTYLIDLESKKIIREFRTQTVCESFEWMYSEFIIVCEADLLVYDVHLLKMIESFPLPDMVRTFELSHDTGELFLELYNGEKAILSKDNGSYQLSPTETQTGANR